MTDETAKALAEAMNRLAAAIEGLGKNQGVAQGGHYVHHQGTAYRDLMQPPWQWSSTSIGR